MDKFTRKFFSDFDSLFNNDFDAFFNHRLNILGETKTEKGQDSNGGWVKQTFESKDGSYKFTTFYRTSINPQNNKPEDKVSVKIGDLKAELQSCVEKQDFEKAAKLRDKINAIEGNKKKIDSLKKDLDIAVKEQNFEKAIELREAIKSLEK